MVSVISAGYSLSLGSFPDVTTGSDCSLCAEHAGAYVIKITRCKFMATTRYDIIYSFTALSTVMFICGEKREESYFQ